MELLQKLTILADAAKYDAACTSSGARRGHKEGMIGCIFSSLVGCCHSFSADGRCVTLLKVLFSNDCSYEPSAKTLPAGHDGVSERQPGAAGNRSVVKQFNSHSPAVL